MPRDILVVDDSQLQRDHAVTLCRSVAPQAIIRECGNGAEALAMLRLQPADAVVMDLEMPVMDGVLLAGYIARERLTMGIVICSSKDPMLIASVGNMIEISGLRVLGMLQKPIKKHLLKQSFAKLESFEPISPKNRREHYEITRKELVAATEREDIRLFFQPKLTATGLVLKGVEALARWHHDKYGLVPPSLFIPLAEQADLIDRLTFTLLRQGVEFIKSCKERGLNLSVSFNLSPQSISKIGFVEQVEDIVHASGIDPKHVIFEVTENMLLRNLQIALTALGRLRLHGFGLSIDDFGTGFANAEQLAMLPATELKIDRALVHGASNKWQQQKILENTIELGRSLNLTTVAEGVELLEDYQLLRTLGVDMVQGFYFAKPMPGEQLNQWINTELKSIRTAARV